MSTDLAGALQALENYRVAIRHRYSSDRIALAELLRQILACKVPKKATALVASLGYDELVFNWDQGSRSPSVRFAVRAGMIPSDPIAFATMNLTVKNITELNSVVLTDLVIEAWADAGGLQAARPLVVWRTLVDSLSVVPEIVMSLRETIRRLTAESDASRSTRAVPLPTPSPALAIRPEHLAACLNADPTALRDWAESLDASGFSEAATRLRWLEGFRDRIAPAVATWIGYGQGLLVFCERADTWWSVGEEENSTPGDGNPDSENLGQLLSSWTDFHPAVEWFCRTLGYTHACVRAKSAQYATLEHDRTYHLAGGEHFVPLAPTAEIIEFQATASPEIRRNGVRSSAESE